MIIKLKDEGYTKEHSVEDEKKLVVAISVLIELGIHHFLQYWVMFDLFLELSVDQQHDVLNCSGLVLSNWFIGLLEPLNFLN